ncbi:putative Dihydrolipoyl dehydrogenase, E3 component of pyruvate and 2-oxoglutarate dehydrogenase complexes [Nitrospira japonica]|uniref:Putative Dihydrolipoyl dehydrogenase, E3 component of pyruvate and 2-oxoglutarate dehydrogenase complexes n=1 Tax=Nitrospira japonica TaxID=1325564 RepID=A0A1W1I2M7_9BACT|nr:dihydrolipoyl dehydrogenase [Nitrospira japonica]SLM47129.1 putative Dihydrolipoyl dehydrogenase, E3 component of pyruvate and 2-oxoglutarate dehydrogenase complexes [Nitrospira japonica]
MANSHDIVIIGGGSAGYAAARTAADRGAQVAIVDQGPLGGLCILRGCMPTKTILRTAEIAALMRRVKEFGLSPVDVTAHLEQIVDRKDRLVREFADYRIEQLRDPRYKLYQGAASFLSPNRVRIGSQEVEAKAFVIATGSVPNDISVPGLHETGYLTSDTLLDLRDRPASMVVLGGGPVALEFGQFFARIGTAVTIIQRSPHLLSHLDPDVGSALEQALREEGIVLYTGTALQRVERSGSNKRVTFHHEGREVHADGALILQALGRRPRIDGLALDKAGVAVINGRVAVDDTMRTSQPHIFAAGDVTNLYDIVHIAVQQGELAGFNALQSEGALRSFDSRLVTDVTFTEPQVATVGLSEMACRAGGIPHLAASYPFADHGKAMCRGDRHGFVKLVASPAGGKLLGAQIVGPEAGELIHELIAVMYYHGTVADLLRMPHYHPTLAEIITYPAETLAERIGLP